MSRIQTYAVRAAVITKLRTTAGVTALVADRVYPIAPPQSPAWPFLRYGTPIVGPYEYTCGEGAESTVTIHAFSRNEKEAQDIEAAVVAALDNQDLPLAAGVGLHSAYWTGTQYLVDGDEPTALHVLISFQITTI